MSITMLNQSAFANVYFGSYISRLETRIQELESPQHSEKGYGSDYTPVGVLIKLWLHYLKDPFMTGNSTIAHT
jgi:hypothetical protein